MFRYRVAAQAFTVIAMVAGGMYYNKDREASKELRKLKEARDAEEKRQRWIKELEVRDQEEKDMRAQIHERKTRSEAAKIAAKAKPAADAAAAADGEPKTGGVLAALNLSNGWGKQGEAPAADAKAPADAKAVSAPADTKTVVVDIKTASDVKATPAEPAPVKPAEPSK